MITALPTVQLGMTDLHITRVGLGAWAIGGSSGPAAWGAQDDQDSLATIRYAIERGVNWIDTAPFYGYGKAGRLVGDVLRDLPRENWVLSDKVGRLLRPQKNAGVSAPLRHQLPFDDVFDYSYDGIMRSFEDSLQRLGLARIDILYVHDIGARQHGEEMHPEIMRTFRESGYRALDQLRASGDVGAFGIGVNEREVLLEAVDWGDWDVFLLAGRYTLLEKGPIEDLLPRCLCNGISIVIGAPFNTGILAGRRAVPDGPAVRAGRLS